MHIQPYLHYQGRCEEAVEFYQGALGAEVMALFHAKDVPDTAKKDVPGADQLAGDKVIYARLRIGDTILHATDAPCQGHLGFAGFSFALFAPDQAEAARLFAALADGGQVQVPLGPTFFSSYVGMVTDRFGLTWRLDAAA